MHAWQKGLCWLLIAGKLGGNLPRDSSHAVNSHKFLQTLEQQLAQLSQAIAPHADQAVAGSRFDRQLFQCHGTRLRDYLEEVAHNVHALRQLVADQRTDRVLFVTEKLVAQIGALQRELSTLTLRQQETGLAPAPVDIYQKLAQHQDYERRLNLMVQDRESQLDRAVTLQQQQQLQREIVVLEGRLARCRQALGRLERQLERQEQGR